VGRDILMISIVGGGTLALRSVFIVGSLGLPPRLQQVMRHAKPAILAALVGGFLAGGGSGIRADGIAAVVVAGVIVRRGGNMLTAIAGGLAAAVLFRF
jgi:branched-subunit amino acid transport protein